MLTVSLVNYRRLNSGKMQKVETVGNKKKKMGNESGTISHVFKKKAGLRDLRIPGICIVPKQTGFSLRETSPTSRFLASNRRSRSRRIRISYRQLNA